MALETWDDIGSTLQQAENNVKGSQVPSDQGFPYTGDYGFNFTILSNFSSDDYKNTVETAINTCLATYGNPVKNSNGAFKTGFFVTTSAKRMNSSYYSYRDMYENGLAQGIMANPDVYSSMSNMFADGSKVSAFVLRVPIYFSTPNVTLPVFFLLFSHGVEAQGKFAWIYSSNIGSLPYFSGGSSYTQGGVNQIFLISRQSGDDNVFSKLISGASGAGASVSDAVGSNLAWLAQLLRVRGQGELMLACTYPYTSLLNSTLSEAEITRDIVGYSSGINGDSAMAQELLYSTLPIWDASINIAEDVYNYITTGVIANTWYHQTPEYEPAISAEISDTTTNWKVQVVGDTNPKYRINYATPALGTASASVRRKWRGNIFVDSWWSSVPSENIRQFEKSDIVLYDKPYVNHGVLFSIKYSELYDKVLQFIYSNMGDGSYVPPSYDTWLGNPWLSSGAAYKFRIGMCAYCDNQISNIVYVDIIFDSTGGISWGTLEDYGDDSIVIIDVYDDDTIDNLGGEKYIPVPVSDDGYTGVIDVVDSDADADYDSGSGDLPEDTITPTSGTGVSIAGRFSTTYQVTPAQLKAISDYFWNDGADGFVSKYINAVNNPIESIISVGYLPISVTDSVGSASIFIGNVNLTDQASGCTGYVVDNTTRKITIGELEIPEVYSSFLDYQPYTNLTVFLPYIGFKTLPTNVFMGKTMKVEYVFDIITGACKALLYADGKYILSFDSDCMIRIPLTSSNNSDVFMQRLRSAVEAGVSLMGASVGQISSGGTRTTSGERFSRSKADASKGYAMKRTSTWSETVSKEPTTYHNFGGAVSQVMGAGLDIAMAKHTYETFGGASSAVASVEPMSVYVIIDSPTVQYPATYNHNCGKPCELSKYLSSLNGYTEVDGGIDLNGIPCTDAEREEIHALLVSGVYL